MALWAKGGRRPQAWWEFETGYLRILIITGTPRP